MEVGLGLGTNEGDRLKNLQCAVEHLQQLRGADLVARAPVYETEPVDVLPAFSGQNYLNTVVILEWSGSLRELLHNTRNIEEQMGRVRGDMPNLPRPIDIDILYGLDEQSKTTELTVPHPRCTSRAFVLRPLADVRPLLVLPGENETIYELLTKLRDDKWVRPYAPQS